MQAQEPKEYASETITMFQERMPHIIRIDEHAKTNPDFQQLPPLLAPEVRPTT